MRHSCNTRFYFVLLILVVVWVRGGLLFCNCSLMKSRMHVLWYIFFQTVLGIAFWHLSIFLAVFQVLYAIY